MVHSGSDNGHDDIRWLSGGHRGVPDTYSARQVLPLKAAVCNNMHPSGVRRSHARRYGSASGMRSPSWLRTVSFESRDDIEIRRSLQMLLETRLKMCLWLTRAVRQRVTEIQLHHYFMKIRIVSSIIKEA